MKRLFFVLIALSIFACSKEQEKLELFGEEAFAFFLDESWELNSTANIKGFTLLEDEDDNYYANLSYSINLISPSSDTLKNVDYGSINEKNEEEFIELNLESQIEIDSAFATGNYKIVFIVDDKLSNRQVVSEKVFELTKE